MKKYAVTSTNFSGELYYTYNDEGIFVGIEILAAMNRSQIKGVINTIPVDEAGLKQMVNTYKTMRIDEVPFDLSFESFWKAYNYKVSKKDAEKAWKNTSDANKVIAIKSIPAYDKWLQTKSQPKVYPATYLNKERYFDDFAK